MPNDPLKRNLRAYSLTPDRLRLIQQCIYKTRAANNLPVSLTDAELVLHSGVWAEVLIDVPTDALLAAHQHAMRTVKSARDITPVAVLQSYREMSSKSTNYVPAEEYLALRDGNDIQGDSSPL